MFHGSESNAAKSWGSKVIAGICGNYGCSSTHQWIGLRENLQETMVFTIKYRAFL
jgi:hypothetical protein